jgi:hypothetical protein
LGAGLYRVSFAFTAVDAIPGWLCAFIALCRWHDREASDLAFFGGLIDPLVPRCLTDGLPRFHFR